MLKKQTIKSRGYLFSWDTFEECWLNQYLIKGKNRDYIIDSGLGAESMEPLKDYLDKDKEIILINTHYHWDHIWGNDAIKNSLIIAHRFCRDMIVEQWEAMNEKHRAYQRGPVNMRLPDLVFDSVISFPDDHLRLFHTPGHTRDSISILDTSEGVLICGDNIGDTQHDIVPSLYDMKEHYIKSLDLYLQLDFDTVISGHNEIVGKDVFSNIINKMTKRS